MPELPDVPTFKESGFDFVHTPWYGLMTSARAARRSTGHRGIVRSAKVQENLKAHVLLGLADTSAQFDEMIRSDTAAARRCVQGSELVGPV
jgi:tripartite-type tricarboxylate transporter receptor subunit TctC